MILWSGLPDCHLMRFCALLSDKIHERCKTDCVYTHAWKTGTQSKEKTDCVLKAVVYKFAGGDLQAGNKICFSGRWWFWCVTMVLNLKHSEYVLFFTTWHFSKIKISNKKKLPPIQSWFVLHIIMKREFKVFSVLVESWVNNMAHCHAVQCFKVIRFVHRRY